MSNLIQAANSASGVSGPPSAGEYAADRNFRGIALSSAFIIVLLVAYILWEIGREAMPAVPVLAPDGRRLQADCSLRSKQRV